MKKIFVVLVMLVSITSCGENNRPDETQSKINQENKVNEEEKYNYVSISPDSMLVAVINTKLGDIEIELFPNETPITVTNFVTLAEENFYDGVIFHRVVPGFVIQGGDPTGTGSGGKSIYDGKPYVNEIVEGLGHDSAGVVAMANRGPDTNTSQFYITLSAVPQLNGNYTVFGKVIKGMDVVNQIGNAETQPPYDRPVDPVAMEKVTIERRAKQK